MTTLPGALGLPGEHVQAVLAAAGLAPSLHNIQPWRFALRPDRIELRADPGSRLPATDPDDRELRLWCGAALFNLRLALAVRGVQPLVTLSHHPWPGDDPDRPLAVVRNGGRARSRADIAVLERAIPNRRTVRTPFRDAAVPSAHRVRLGKAAGDERCWLRNVDEATDRARLQTLIARAHRAQTQDLAVRAELAAWSGHDGGRPDGVPLTASGPRPEPQDEWLLRDFGGEAGRARTPGKDFESSPLILVLQSYSDGPAEQVQAGQALQRVLLTVTSLGLSASLISQPIEVAAIRGELRRMLGSHLTPQAVLRVGYGSSVRPTPRRPITDLVVPAIEGDPVCAPRI